MLKPQLVKQARLPILFTFGLVAAHLGSVGTAQTGSEQDFEEFEAAQIHSDLPIYTFNFDELWPRPIEPSKDAIAGCTSRVSFGDWQFTPNDKSDWDDVWWLRISNYGVLHCAANLRHADGQDALDDSEFSRGLFARIGVEDVDEPKRELWVLQEGFVPGSDYMLLARKMDEEVVTSFSVLQRRCPIGAFREALGMDVWTTGYCSINSDTDMYRFANEMLKFPPLGELVLQPVVDDDEGTP